MGVQIKMDGRCVECYASGKALRPWVDGSMLCSSCTSGREMEQRLESLSRRCPAPQPKSGVEISRGAFVALLVAMIVPWLILLSSDITFSWS